MWAFWIVTELLLAIILAAFAFTQILWPALTKSPFFPSFRRRARELHAVEDDIHDTKLAIHIQRKRQELEELQRRAARLKEGGSNP
jgi:hypothetical protein